MSRREASSSKREEYKEIQNEISIEVNELKIKSPPVVQDPGGAIVNLKVDTPHFRKWIETIRQRNSLIGSQYVNSAPEYNIESIKLSEEVVDGTPEEIQKIEQNVEENQSIDNIDSIDDDSDKRIIDHSIIEKVTKLYLNSSIEDIAKESIKEMKNYYNDESYIPDIDIFSSIQFVQKNIKQNSIKQLK